MKCHHPRPLGFPTKRIVGCLLLVFLFASASFAQDDQPAAPSPTPVPAPTPIPASQIPARTGEVAALLRGIEAHAQPQDEIAEIADSQSATAERIDDLETEVLALLENDGPVQALRDADTDLVRVERRLVGWLDTLKDRTVELDSDLEDLRRRKSLWELTRDEADAAELPAALVTQVQETIMAIGRTEKSIGERRADVLTIQAGMTEQRSRVRAFREEIGREAELRQLDLLHLDSPPLWKAFGDSQNEDLGEQVLAAVRKNLGVFESFIRENLGSVMRSGVVFLIMLILFVRFRRKAQLWVRSDETLRTTAAVLERPVASSLLVTIMVGGGWFQPTAPAAYFNIVGLVLLLVTLRLLPFLVRPEIRPAVGMFVGLVAGYLLVDLIPSAFVLHRVCELLLAVLGAATCVWVLHRERSVVRDTKDGWYWSAIWLARSAVVVFSASVVANVAGAVALSSILVVATLGSIYDAITLWMVVVVLFGAVTIVLRTTTARRLLIVRYHSDRIRSVVFRLIKAIAVLVWVAAVLDYFGALEGTTSFLKGVLFFEYTLGDFSFSVSSVGIFIVVIWLSVKLAQFVSFVLDEDVLPRLDLPKGVPATISKTSTYLVVTIGCVIAVAAAGLDLSRATLLVGALGVGIGFGLQNAVNNFVSGLILLFGRPINVGDKIQIGEISGRVKDIGIRATVVLTWQGAEVIVPNATLISDNLVNWTLSDDRRRMEIQVGVAYGSPTTQVIELLTEVAQAHEEVLQNPGPAAIFTGFGDSALDFELRAWTRGNHVKVASDLRLRIDQVLAENGIEIPFPQHDLHLRTVDSEALAKLAGSKVPLGTE